MYRVIAESITGRRGKVAIKGDVISGDMLTDESLKAHLDSKAIEALSEVKEKPAKELKNSK